MKRMPGYTAVLLVLATACSATAQTAQPTFAQRIGSLRDGWSFSSDDATAKPPVRLAQRTTPERSAALATDERRPFPRVNPSELLPRSWFGLRSTNEQKSAPATAPAARPTPSASDAASRHSLSTNGAAGSARARLLRDMQRPTDAATAPAARLARTTKARAGSVLSPNAPAVVRSEAAIAAENARLARAIAADVANSIASEVEPTVDATPETPLPEVVEEDFASDESAAAPEAVADITPVTPIVEETATAEVAERAAPEAPVAAIAETDAGKISVAAKPNNTTKLPMFIGDRYSQYEDESTVETAEETPQSSPAEGAFAAGPRAAASEPTITPGKATEPVEDEDLLLTQRMPVLVSKVSGPRTITVGREANYRVLLANRGDIAADRVVTTVTIPAWAELVGSDAMIGEIDRSANEDGTLTWNAGYLAAGQMIKLDLRLVALSGKPVELGVSHTHQPIDGSTLVEVQEPKLELNLVGPDEVLYGKPQTFRLTLSNPGTGTAENVTLYLTPPGGDADRRTSHDFGMIPAGEDRTVEIELTAREAGQLAVNASANADGDVSAAFTKEVFCRKSELVVDWRGPADRYAGAPAVYYFRVRNPGTATAPDVVLNVDLPTGFEVQPSSGVPKAKNGSVAFNVGSLRAGDDKYFEMRGVLRQAGANAITLRAAASDETRSERVVAMTEVVALADLKLDVLDPKGPVATGQEIEYEIRITNRGSNDARDVRVIGLFSDGIEPHHVDGGASDIVDGRVAFEMIDRIAAGEVVVFTIHARAFEEGTHLFRAEVLCRDLEIKLAAEETTRFFEDEAINVAGDGYPSGSTNSLYPR